jgi:hypothetical protein
MPRVLTALKNFVYAGKRVVPGESFTVKGEDHAKALIGVGRAKLGAGMSVPPSRPAVGRRADSTPAPRSPKAADKPAPAPTPAQPMRTPPKPGRPASPPSGPPKPKPQPQPQPEQPITPEPAPAVPPLTTDIESPPPEPPARQTET